MNACPICGRGSVTDYGATPDSSDHIHTWDGYCLNCGWEGQLPVEVHPPEGAQATLEERRAWIRGTWVPGAKTKDLARKAGVSMRTIETWVADMKTFWKGRRARTIQELAAGGLTNEAISQLLGVSVSTVKRAKRKGEINES